jgi:alpha-galactosidase
MGYNGWLAATTGHEPGAQNQTLYYNIADKLVTSGLAAAGYDTLLAGVCIGWVRDPVTHKLEAPKATWPDGFKALVDYAHGKGLKVGAYTDTGKIGCCHPREIGSYGYEELDVARFAEWGVDHIAVDNCGHPDGASQSVKEYAKIHDALVKVGRPMVYGIWNIGSGKEWAWASKLGHYFRTSSDVGNRWGQSTAQAGNSGLMYNYDIQQAIPAISAISGPGSFAFLDQLMLGQPAGVPHGAGDVGLTPAEAFSHFGIWCIMASPLWITYDIFNPTITNAVQGLVTNAEAVAINQDPLGAMAVRIDGASASPHGLDRRLPGTCGAGGIAGLYPNGEQLARPLANGDTAVLVFNRLADRNVSITLTFTDLGDTTVTCFTVRDVWSYTDVGFFEGSFVAPDVPPHGSRFLRLTPAMNNAQCHTA